MRRKSATTAITYALLAAAAGVGALLPQNMTMPTVHAGPAPNTIRLSGTIWDFRAAHDDFDVTPAIGTGHCANNVLLTLGPSYRPIFNSGGDESGPFDNRIAHWRFDDGNGSTATDEKGANPGSLEGGLSAGWTTGHDGGALHFDGVDDFVNIPSSAGTQISGNITFTGWFKLDDDFNASSPNTMVIMERFLDTEHDFHLALAGLDYNRPEVPKGTLVFKVENGPTSDYYCYVWTNRSSWTAGVWYHYAASLTATDTAANNLFINGVEDTDDTIAAGVGFLDTNYDAPMRIGGKTIDFNGLATDIYFKGTIDDVMIFDRALTGEDFHTVPGGYLVQTEWRDAAGNNIAPHLYTASAIDSCGNAIADIAGVVGTDSDSEITSPQTFDEWFHDLLGTNLSTRHAITLTLNGTVYEYLDDAFFPIDRKLLGNEGLAHNYNFTYGINAHFNYSACTGQFIEFQGGDGTWIFINRELVVDLGGVGSAVNQRIDLDRLNLVDGDAYSIMLFYSARTASTPVFRLRTNLQMTGNVATVSAGYD